MTITSQGETPILEVEALPSSGIAPLDVTFEHAFHSTEAIDTLSLDFDGDGTDDFTTTDPEAFLQHTYTTPGVFLARLTVTDQQGGVHAAQAAVAVQDVVELNAILQQLWDGMNTALLAGDAETAKSFLDAAARKKYGPVFDVLLPYMPQIVASYSALQPLSLSGSIGEYGINRVIDGQNRLFLIYFLKNGEGIWLIAAM